MHLQRILYTLFLVVTFTMSVFAKTDIVDVTIVNADSLVNIPTDAADVKQVANDSIVTPLDSAVVIKKKPWYMKAYGFLEKVLSPKRDSLYIDVQKYNWCAEVQFTGLFEHYTLDGGENFNMELSPDFRPRIGPFFGWRWAFFGYNFDLKTAFSDDGDVELGGSLYTPAFGIDAFYRKVGGRNRINKFVYQDQDYSQIMNRQLFDGVKIGMTRISAYYVLNYKKYSHQAAFSQTNRQLRSAGSPLFGLQYANNTMRFDWDKFASVIARAQGQEIEAKQLVSNLSNDEISLSAGYGYNWVFAKNWLAAISGTASIGFLVQNYKNELDKDASFSDRFINFRRNYLAFDANARASVIWNNGPWFSGVQCVLFYYQYGSTELLTHQLTGTVYLLVGINF